MSTSQIYFNPWDLEFRANPYPYYAPLLAGPPPVIELMQKIALIARYEHVSSVLRDTARFSADGSKRRWGRWRRCAISDHSRARRPS